MALGPLEQRLLVDVARLLRRFGEVLEVLRLDREQRELQLARHADRVVESLDQARVDDLPDLDTQSSYIGRVLRLTSSTLERYFSHRSFTHALLPQTVAALLAWWLLPGGFAMALIAGWVSHSWADMMTKSGVAWFWPARIRCVLPGNSDWRMDVGGPGEFAFLLISILIAVLMMPLAATGKGAGGLIRGALGDLTMARSEYDRDKGTALFSVKISGRDNRTYTDVSGTYPIIGPWATAGFIVESDSGPRSICASTNCDWHASHAKILHGEPIETSSRPIQGATLDASAIHEALQPLEDTGEVYLIGSFLLQGIKAEPPTLEVAGDSVRLGYAKPACSRTGRARPCARSISPPRFATTPALRCPNCHRSTPQPPASRRGCNAGRARPESTAWAAHESRMTRRTIPWHGSCRAITACWCGGRSPGSASRCPGSSAAAGCRG